MASGTTGAVRRQLERLFSDGTAAGLSEGQLLDRFVRHRDGAAFEALVNRHGPMVQSVCRRFLRDPNDADDAFQATFLVLVRRADSLHRRDLLGNWLYGVAYRVARRARATAARRSGTEAATETVADLALAPAADTPGSGPGADPCLHEEVHRLPEKYRAPVVLCYLEGLTHEEAADRLRWPVGTVKGRLARARDLLRSRLARRGVGLAVAAGALDLLATDARAALPERLVIPTLQAATRAATGLPLVGFVTARTLELTDGVTDAMSLTRLIRRGLTSSLIGASLVGSATLALPLTGDAGQQGAGASAAPNSETQKESPASSSSTSATKRSYGHALAEAIDSRIERLDGMGVEELRQTVRFLGAVRDAELVAATTPDGRAQVHQRHVDRMARILQSAQASQGAAAEAKRALAQSSLDEAKQQATNSPNTGISLSIPAFDSAGAPPASDPFGGRTGSVAQPGAPTSSGSPGASRSANATTAKPTTDPPNRGAGTGGGVLPGRMEGGGLEDVPFDDLSDGEKRIVLSGLSRKIAKQDESPRTREILDVLDGPVAMQFPNETPLQDVLDFIKKSTAGQTKFGLPIYVDPVGLAEAEKTVTSPVTLDLEGVPLKTTLRLALKQLGLAYCVKDGLIIISSVDGILQELRESENVTEPGEVSGRNRRTTRGLQ